MNLLARLLCVMLSVSFVLLPLSRVHAHVSGEGHGYVNVHGGHDHDVGHGHEHDGGTHDHDTGSVHEHGDVGTVVKLKSDLSQGSFQAWKPIHWLAVLFVIAIVVFELLPDRLIPRPPRTRTRPPSPYPHPLPLLRGPPASI